MASQEVNAISTFQTGIRRKISNEKHLTTKTENDIKYSIYSDSNIIKIEDIKTGTVTVFDDTNHDGVLDRRVVLSNGKKGKDGNLDFSTGKISFDQASIVTKENGEDQSLCNNTFMIDQYYKLGKIYIKEDTDHNGKYDKETILSTNKKDNIALNILRLISASNKKINGRLDFSKCFNIYNYKLDEKKEEAYFKSMQEDIKQLSKELEQERKIKLKEEKLYKELLAENKKLEDKYGKFKIHKIDDYNYITEKNGVKYKINLGYLYLSVTNMETGENASTNLNNRFANTKYQDREKLTEILKTYPGDVLMDFIKENVKIDTKIEDPKILKEMKEKNFSGAHINENNTIYFRNGAYSKLDLAHEFGHALDGGFYDDEGMSSSKEFKDTFNEEFKNCKTELPGLSVYRDMYAIENNDEMFAECYTLLMTGKCARSYAGLVSKYFPKTLALVEKYINKRREEDTETRSGRSIESQDLEYLNSTLFNTYTL